LGTDVVAALDKANAALADAQKHQQFAADLVRSAEAVMAQATADAVDIIAKAEGPSQCHGGCRQ
jgi:hypothetical protein